MNVNHCTPVEGIANTETPIYIKTAAGGMQPQLPTCLILVRGMSTYAASGAATGTVGGTVVEGTKFSISWARIRPSGPVPRTNCKKHWQV